MNNNLIEVQGLNFKYNKDIPILNDISFSVKEGEIVGILGPNGCGKTTLFDILSTFRKCDSGNIYFDKQDISKVKLLEKAKIFSYIQQRKELQSENIYDINDFVLQGRRPYSRFGFYSKEDKGICLKSIEKCNLVELINSQVSTLSGGEFQRCELARAITQNTKILICDEPVSAMDIKYQKDFFKIMKSLITDSSKCSIISLHDINLAKTFCDRLIVLNKGEIQFNDTPDKLCSKLLSSIYDTPIGKTTNRNNLFDYYSCN
jgi:iron complex transport system ATP-binding protein